MPFLRSKRTWTDEEACWVCLEGGGDHGGGGLVRLCRCPRAVHPVCLARWQLRSAGKGEETHCRFCSERLPDWRQSLTPHAAAEVRRCGLAPPATMTVAFLGQTHELEVESGPNGFEEFLGKVRSLFGIDAEQQMDLTFDCAEPATGQPLQLAGSGAFDAAVHCAAMAAASRARKRLRRSAIARRLLAPFARSASCHATMDTATSADSATTESRDPPAGPMRRSARSTSSLSSSSTELPGPGAHINVQPAHSDIDVQGDEAAPKGIALPQPRWGLSSDCERLLWR